MTNEKAIKILEGLLLEFKPGAIKSALTLAISSLTQKGWDREYLRKEIDKLNIHVCEGYHIDWVDKEEVIKIIASLPTTSIKEV